MLGAAVMTNLPVDKSHRGRVLGILPARVSYLKLEMRFIFVAP